MHWLQDVLKWIGLHSQNVSLVASKKEWPSDLSDRVLSYSNLSLSQYPSLSKPLDWEIFNSIPFTKIGSFHYFQSQWKGIIYFWMKSKKPYHQFPMYSRGFIHFPIASRVVAKERSTALAGIGRRIYEWRSNWEQCACKVVLTKKAKQKSPLGARRVVPECSSGFPEAFIIWPEGENEWNNFLFKTIVNYNIKMNTYKMAQLRQSQDKTNWKKYFLHNSAYFGLCSLYRWPEILQGVSAQPNYTSALHIL